MVDDVYGSFRGPVRVQWFFADYPHKWVPDGLSLELQTPSGAFQCSIHTEQPNTASLVIGGNASSGTRSEIRGWRSLYYGQKEPAISVAAERDGALPVRFVTILAHQLYV